MSQCFLFVVSPTTSISILSNKWMNYLFQSSPRCARRRTATSSAWMWSISPPRSCRCVWMKSSSQYTPGTRPDRWAVEAETLWAVTDRLPTSLCANPLPLPTGRPRLRVQRVSEEVQASCGRDLLRNHFLSVRRRRALDHRSALLLRHGPQHSNHVRGRKTEDVEAADAVQILTPVTACCFFFSINLFQCGWHSSTYTK